MHILKKRATPLLDCFSFLFCSRVFLFFWRENKKSPDNWYIPIFLIWHILYWMFYITYIQCTPHTHKMAQMDIFSWFLLDVRVYFIYTTYLVLISKVSSKMCVCVSFFVANYTLINDSKGLWEKMSLTMAKASSI